MSVNGTWPGRIDSSGVAAPISPTLFLTGATEVQWLALQRLYRVHYEQAIEQAPLPPEHPLVLDA